MTPTNSSPGHPNEHLPHRMNKAGIPALNLVLTLLLVLAPNSARSQAVSVSYQGQLAMSNLPVTGTFDFRFTVFDADGLSGAIIAGPVTNSAVSVSNGLFFALPEFPASAFEGSPRFLELAVRESVSNHSFESLQPRQPVAWTPNAVVALTAKSVASGSVSTLQLADDAVTSDKLDAGLEVTKLGDGLVNNAELSHLDGVAANVQLQLDARILSTNGVARGLTLEGAFVFQGAEALLQSTDAAGSVTNQLFARLADALDAAPNDSTVNLLRPTAVERAGGGAFSGQFGPTNAPFRIHLKTNVTVDLGWYRITANGSTGNVFSIYNSRNISLKGLVVEGNGENNANGNFVYDAVVNLAGGNENIWFNGGHLKGFSGHGIAHLRGAKTSTNVYIGNYVFEDLGVTNHPHLSIDGSAIAGIGPQWTVENSSFIDLLRGIEHESGVDQIIVGFNANNLYFRNIYDKAIMQFSPQQLYRGINYRNVHIWDMTNTLPTSSAIWFSKVNGLNFSGLYMTNIRTQGFNLQPDLGDIRDVNLSDFIIHNVGNNAIVLDDDGPHQLKNINIGPGVIHTITESGIRLDDVIDVRITGVQIHFTSGSGIAVTGTETTNVTVINNDLGGEDIYVDSLVPPAEVHLINNRNAGHAGAAVPLLHFTEAGNVGIGTASPASKLNVAGIVTATEFNSSSDRALKENFVPVDPAKILDSVAGLPLSEWSFSATPQRRHLGPTAQDFYQAFGLGGDDRHIATVDADGVALAAIKALIQQMSAKDQRLNSLTNRISDLSKRLETLERHLINSNRLRVMPPEETQ